MTDRITNYGNSRYIRKLGSKIWYDEFVREQRRMWDNYFRVFRYGYVRGIIKWDENAEI